MTRTQNDVWQQIDRLKDFTPSEASTQHAMDRVRAAFSDRLCDDNVVERHHGAGRTRWQLALAGCLAAGIAAIACFVIMSQGAVAFAEVQEQIQSMRTVTYRFVSGEPANRIAVRHVVSGTRERSEWPGHVRIHIPAQKTSLLINHDDRTAQFSHDNSGTGREGTDLYEKLVDIADSSVREVGRRTIEGMPAVGFEVPETEDGEGAPMLVWVDPRTKLPIKIIASGNRVLEDFEFDVHVDESLFELKAPAGYFVEHRYRAPQAPLELKESELQTYASLVTDPERSPQQTITAYLKLASAGKTELAARLQRDASPDDVRALDGFEDLKLARTYVTDLAALGITSAAIAYRGDLQAMVFRLEWTEGSWLIEDIDLESADGLKNEVERFLAEHPQAEEVE